MSARTLYGISSCDTCRKARKWLADKGREFCFHDLRTDGIDIRMLERWSESIDWRMILNTRSQTWRRIPEIDRADLSKSSAFALLLDEPTLVKRPVLESGKTVAVGFSPKAYETLFGRKGT